MNRYILDVTVTLPPDNRLLRSRRTVQADTLAAASLVSAYAAERYMEQLVGKHVPATQDAELEGSGTWKLSRIREDHTR